MAGNPDASRSFAGRASDAPEPRGLADRDGSSGSADRPRAGRDIAPPVHIRRRNRSGRGRSSCRSAPERGNAHTRTAGLALPPAQARPHMDGVGNAWNNAPACVLGTVWGTASIRTWRFRSAPCLPIGRLSPRQFASEHALMLRGARTPVDMWTTQERCPHIHRRNNQQQTFNLILQKSLGSGPARHIQNLKLGSRDASQPP